MKPSKLRRLSSAVAHVMPLACAVTLTACASSQLPPGTTKSAAPSQVATAMSSRLTEEEATRIVATSRARFAAPDAENPLRNPKSTDDVLAILRSDQIDLFAGGVAFAKKSDDVKSRALRAQLEVAWGEDQRIVAQMLDTLGGELREEIRDLETMEAAGKLDEAQKKQLDRLSALVSDSAPLVAALSRLAPVHLSRGKVIAEELVKTDPGNYEGYRVLADYYRLRGEWSEFDAALAKAEKLNPASTGIVFLKGISLAERQRDFAGASAAMKEALKRDPQFARAQAHALLFADGLPAKVEEYRRLEAMSPQHQLVLLAGPALEEAIEVRQRRIQRFQRNEVRAVPRAPL